MEPDRSSKLQLVLTRIQKAQVVRWIQYAVLTHRLTNIYSKTINHFRNFFRTSRNGALMKLMLISCSREQYIGEERSVILRGMTSSFTRVTKDEIRRVDMKASAGRGRKRAVWAAELYTDLLLEFDRLHRLHVKMNMRTIIILAEYLIRNSSKDS